MKFSLALLSLSLIVGCATPTKVQLDGEETVTVHTLDAVAIPKATVMDQNGKAMEGQTITWEVTPAEVAALSADKKSVELKADGEATVTAKSGSLSDSMKIVVALPDDIQVGGVAEGDTIGVGATKDLTGTVTAKGTEVAGQAVEFSSSDAAILKVEGNVATGVAAGEARIKATSGSLMKEIAVKVGDVAATDAAAAGAK